uniref:Peptidase M12B domain-containing protein n=1 Tax=Plectus sambesii TaxID=2011161 RepID=A0A914WEY8_9BILA
MRFNVFRFCKFGKQGGTVESSDDTTNKRAPLEALKVLKLDLCYGSLTHIVHRFLDATGVQLKILSLNQICEDLSLLDLYQLIAPLHRRNISLHLGLLQKSTPGKKKRREELLPIPPTLFRSVLWKLEASFLDDEELLDALLSSGVYSFANEFKFVQCSGCNLTQNGQMVGGLAYSDQVCTDGSCSVISGGVGAGLRAGYTLAHEIGHAINMKHDGDTRYAETSHCDPNCCMMTPYGASSTAAEWSVCSKMRYHEKLVGMMVDDSNCLESLDAVTPPKEMPGQEKPDEGQCMDQLGSCGRHYISDDSDCTKLYCTNTNGETATVFEIIRLDGSHCGPNKICEMGICVESPVTLPIVDGGWSGWNSNPEDICGGSNCSVCTVNDQVSARVEVRRCDNPYPLNGGAPCPGLNVRGIFCANCSNTGSLIDVDSHETNQCSAKYPGSIVTATTDCTFVCSLDGVFQGRLWLPAGTLCSDNGRCINGQCLHTLCADLNVYVGAVSDCPTDTVVDCRYSPWSQLVAAAVHKRARVR